MVRPENPSTNPRVHRYLPRLREPRSTFICGFPGKFITVYDGILVSAAKSSDGSPEIYVSRDDGVNWTILPLTDSNGNLVANGTGSMLPVSRVDLPSDSTPWVSADPIKTGRFALVVPRVNTLEIYFTENTGEHFVGSISIVIQAPDAHRPAVDFGFTGLLGVMWRTDSSGPLDAYSWHPSKPHTRRNLSAWTASPVTAPRLLR